MKQTKKGFTLVELLVVIAILAVLATVSIVGYLSFINKAQLSVDQQITEQMNIVLEAESIMEAPQTVDQVREFLEGAGFNPNNSFVPTMEGYTFYWYKTYNVIVLVNEEDGSIYTPAENREMVEAFQADFANNKKDIYNLNNTDPNRLWYADAPVASVPPYKFQEGLQANVQGSGPVDTDFIKEIKGYGWLYTFYPVDENGNEYLDQREKYADWIADFAIIANDDFAADTVGITGQYSLDSYVFPWIPITTDVDIEEGTIILLMQDVISQAFGNFQISYESLVEICAPKDGEERKGFNCGAYNFSEDNLGKSITVELRLYEPAEDGSGLTGRYIVCNSVVLTFDDVAVNRP